MTAFTFPDAQSEMREVYFHGAPGVLVSGLVWLVAGGVALGVSQQAAVYALLIGGAMIFPLSLVLTKLLGRRGAHASDNPLGKLAMEGTFWMLAGIAIAYGVSVLRIEWFFPVMLLIIGGRYLTFQTLYGLRLYWVLGAVLCGAGMALAMLRAPVMMSALAGGAIEVVFAGILFLQARQSSSAGSEREA
jgi:hypothetical protein